MANVLILKRACACKSCQESKILTRWKNANRTYLEFQGLCQAISTELNLKSVCKKILREQIETVVVFVNLGCSALPELALRDQEDMEKVVSHLSAAVPCSIYGILHRPLEESSTQEQYVITHLRNVS